MTTPITSDDMPRLARKETATTASPLDRLEFLETKGDLLRQLGVSEIEITHITFFSIDPTDIE